MRITNNYINEAIKNPRYTILLNGKEVKKIPFYKQAKKYANSRSGDLFGNVYEVVDMITGEII